MDNQLGQIQKIYSTSHFICINLRFPGKSRNIYLGRGGGFEGFWEGSDKPKSSLRVRDRYLDYLRRYLTSGLVSAVHVDKKDRILVLVFQRFGLKNYFMVFWSGRKSYFLTYTFSDAQHPRLFLSWKGEMKGVLKAEAQGELPDEETLLSHFDEVGRSEQTLSISKGSKEINDLLADEEKKVLINRVVKQRENFLSKKLKNIKGDLDRVEVYRDLEEMAANPDLNLDQVEELKKEHVTLKFKTESGHFQKLNSLYNKIKKLKLAKNILEKRQSDTEEELLRAKDNPQEEVERVADKIVGPIWKIEKNINKGSHSQLSPKNLIQEFVLHGKSIGIGLTAQGNDYLRSVWGKAEHLWFHLDGETSAHLIVKTEHFSQLTPEDLTTITSLLWDYSKKSILPVGSLVPLLFTQVKNLKGIRGTTGAVNYKKEKHLSIPYDPHWKSHVEKISY